MILNNAYAGLLYTDDYVMGAIAVAHSLSYVNSVYPFFLLADSTLSDETFNLLNQVNIKYIKIDTESINHSVKRWNKTINYF